MRLMKFVHMQYCNTCRQSLEKQTIFFMTVARSPGITLQIINKDQNLDNASCFCVADEKKHVTSLGIR